ncbi:MAG: hypothetical protein II842_04280 [Butyrivibrio sp.]|nr:hypothetical protein [Butyrivibrio sp.]
MMNTNNRELNMNELSMVTGGTEAMYEAEIFCGSDPINPNEFGIPRGGKVTVRV